MKFLYFLLLAILVSSCSSLEKTFNGGKIQAKKYTEVIPFTYDYDLALIDVVINKKTYKFLLDTGAPTVISKEIFKDLNIEPARTTIVTDSQGNRGNQDVAVIPEMMIGNLKYSKIGAIVASLREVFEFNCMGIDGIIGSNQMAKSYLKFDYQTQQVTITDDLSQFNLSGYNKNNFNVNAQRTPKIKGTVNGVETVFVYDTGFAGNLDVDETLLDYDKLDGFTSYGSSSIGLYNAVDSTSIRTVKLNKVSIGTASLTNQLADLDSRGLVGNDFMNKHEVILDWKKQRLFLKKVRSYEDASFSSFGFKLRFKNNQLVVSALIKEIPSDLQVGDVILKINELDYTGLDDQSACTAYTSYDLKEVDTAVITYQRDGAIKTIELTKKSLFSN